MGHVLTIQIQDCSDPKEMLFVYQHWPVQTCFVAVVVVLKAVAKMTLAPDAQSWLSYDEYHQKDAGECQMYLQQKDTKIVKL